MKVYYLYILTNTYNTVLYVGITNNLERRIWEHQNKMIDGFTKKYNLWKVVYTEEFANIEDAIGVEKKIKGWTRKKKDLLITKNNPQWNDLSAKELQ